MPLPTSLQVASWAIADRPVILDWNLWPACRDVDRGVQRFITHLSEQTGMLLPILSAQKSPTLSVHLDRGNESIEKLGADESYQLRVTTSGATLSPPNPLGILHGLQTFLQLVKT